MNKNLTLSQEKKLLEIIKLVNEKEIKRMGKLFNTNLNNYFYDTGTGKVILLDDESYYIINKWLSVDNITFKSIFNDKEINIKSLLEVLDICIKENIFMAPKPLTICKGYYKKDLKKIIDNNLEQLILEVTGKCNLRCDYCIYNDEYECNRNFNDENMTQESAIKAVDYFFEHSRNNIAITFYGGEPLLRFELLKNIINYSIEKNKIFKKRLTFGLTTNMTMITPEIAEYFSTIPGLSIVGSLDGPELIHDSYRKFKNGSGSFNLAFKGLKTLSEAFKNKSMDEYPLTINTVFAPPYTYEKLNDINNFFKELNFIPKNTRLTITYPIDGSVKDEENYLIKLSQNPKYKNKNYEEINPLWEWQIMNQKNEKKINPNSIIGSGFDQIIQIVTNRYISNEPSDIYPLNACCVPGARRLYVNTKGEYSPCERIGTCPSIGNIDVGIDFKKIKKHYIEEYSEKSINECSKCWAIRMCGLCYAGRYTKDGFRHLKRECDGIRKVTERYLSYYHSVLEEDSNKLELLNEIEIC